MKVSKKNKKIVIQQYDKSEKEWMDYKELWASILEPETSIVEVAGNPTSVLTRKLCIWRRDDVKKGQHVKYGSSIYEIIHTYASADNTETFIICKEWVM